MLSQKQKFTFRRWMYEIISAAVAVVGYLIAYFLRERAGWSLTLSIGVTLIALVFIIHARTRERDFYFLPLQKSSEKADWIGRGSFEFNRVEKGYAITDSDSGFLFSKCLTWSDYECSFDFHILNASVGVIVRATNLSNLVMLQIFDYGVKPHIRINSLWNGWAPEQVGLQFSDKLSLSKWYKCRVTCNKDAISIKITELDGQILFDREWAIPTGAILFLPPQPASQTQGQAPLPSVPFSINLEYGTVGFRNNGVEKAAVKDVLVEKLGLGE